MVRVTGRRPLIWGVISLLFMLTALMPARLMAQSGPTNPVPDLTAAKAVVAANPLAWKPCDGGLECATLTVPLDYNGKVSGNTTLSLARVRAADTANRIGALVFNLGGPGAPAISTLRAAHGKVFPAEITARFDIVAVDPRGIGESNQVDCKLQSLPPEDETLSQGSPNDDRAWAYKLSRASMIADLCAKNAGPLLNFMGTNEFTIDLEMLRVAMGEPKLNYFGFSYGTQVGALYTERFPGSIRSLVMDAAVNLNLSGATEVYEQAVGREEVANHFLYECGRTPACPFYSGGHPVATYDALLAALETQASAGDADAAQLLAILRGLSSRFSGSTSTWAGYAAILNDIAQGNLASLAQLLQGVQDPTAETDDDGEPIEDIGFTAVECLDWQWPATDTGFRDLARSIEKAAPRVGGSVEAHLPCLYWPARPSLSAAPTVGRGAPPVLVVASTFDPATPYFWSVALAGQLESGILLTREGVGHTSLTDSACIETTIVTYIITLQPPPKGTTCPTTPVNDLWTVPDSDSSIPQPSVRG